jgi:hypothetical protein
MAVPRRNIIPGEYDRSFGPLGLEPSHKFGIRRDTRPLYEQSSLY